MVHAQPLQRRWRRCVIAPMRARRQMPSTQMAIKDRAARNERALGRALAKARRANAKLREEVANLHTLVQGYLADEFQRAEQAERQRQLEELEEIESNMSTPRSPPPAPFEEDDAPVTPPVHNARPSTPTAPRKLIYGC